MSIATMSAKAHRLIPQDELIGSLTRERVSLLVRHAGADKLPDVGTTLARLWLSYVLDTDVPAEPFDTLCHAFTTASMLEDVDLELWYDLANTEANREAMQAKADYSLDYCVRQLTAILCDRLGVTA